MGFSFMHFLFFMIAVVAIGWKIYVSSFVFKNVFGKGVSAKEAIGKYLEHQKEDRYYRIHRAKSSQDEKK